ncbi:MAG: hypothetical protein IMY76_03660 [Chloroflexi bacterium]|nr:hypothetical protein [Chloroflexota bacterium]
MMNIVAAIIAGLIGTVVITMFMSMAPKMGMPKMDMVGMLGSMFGTPSNRGLGLFIHLMMGVVFGLVYAYLWSAGVGSATLVGGIVFGIVHWLATGMMMAPMPLMHAGIKSGDVPAPGAYMIKNGGMKSFMGGLVGHAVFGLVVALIYPLF